MKYREQKSNVPVVPICPGQNGTPVSVSVSASVSDSSSKRGSAEGEVQIKVVPGWETEFEECWALYPDKSGKAKARAAYQKAHKEGVTQEQVLMGLNRYAWWLDQKRSGGFKDLKAKNGATWFGQQCWQDEYTVEDRRKHEKPRFE